MRKSLIFILSIILIFSICDVVNAGIETFTNQYDVSGVVELRTGPTWSVINNTEDTFCGGANCQVVDLTGKAVWRIYLATYPDIPSPPWSPDSTIVLGSLVMLSSTYKVENYVFPGQGESYVVFNSDYFGYLHDARFYIPDQYGIYSVGYPFIGNFPNITLPEFGVSVQLDTQFVPQFEGDFNHFTIPINSNTGIIGSALYFYNGTPVPEPASILLLGLGLIGLAGVRRRFKK